MCFSTKKTITELNPEELQAQFDEDFCRLFNPSRLTEWRWLVTKTFRKERCISSTFQKFSSFDDGELQRYDGNSERLLSKRNKVLDVLRTYCKRRVKRSKTILNFKVLITLSEKQTNSETAKNVKP